VQRDSIGLVVAEKIMDVYDLVSSNGEKVILASGNRAWNKLIRGRGE